MVLGRSQLASIATLLLSSVANILSEKKEWLGKSPPFDVVSIDQPTTGRFHRASVAGCSDSSAAIETGSRSARCSVSPRSAVVRV